MEISLSKNNGKTILGVSGRLDTNTSGDFEKILNGLLELGEKYIIVDLKDVVYLSSAALRVFLGAQKQINTLNGELTVINSNPTVKEIFTITGFTEFIKII